MAVVEVAATAVASLVAAHTAQEEEDVTVLVVIEGVATEAVSQVVGPVAVA